MRKEIDRAFESWDIPTTWLDRAREWCRNVRIIATGGFTPERISQFEAQKVPVDIYGVGSYLYSNCTRCGTNNDYTADIVQVRINGEWYNLAKTGRQACDNPDLQPVQEREECSLVKQIKE
jgi:nicotinate phosphoribosyltransferase